MHSNNWWINHPAIRILQHLCFWVLSFFIFLNIFKSGSEAEEIDYIYTGLFHITILPAVYLHLELFFPKLARSGKWIWYILATLLLIILFTWINYSFFDNWSVKILPDYFFISYFTWWQVAYFYFVYIGITTLFKLSRSWFAVNELQRELLESEKQKVQIELKALKSQINPHFFFNTLNSIYSMSLDKDDRLPATVLQLSGLMRYFLYESVEDFVPLEKEVAVLKAYIALQKIRSGNELNVELRTEGEVMNQKIAPLLLITFLENSFKHGAKGGSENTFINLELIIHSDKLEFRVENNKGIVDEIESTNYKGVGLENVKRQLQLLYPARHKLIVNDQDDRFVINLKLTL